MSGYTSAQELLKLVRDVLPLKPDIVIQWDYDIGFLHSFPAIHSSISFFKTLSSLPVSSFKTKTGKTRSQASIVALDQTYLTQ